MNVILISTSNVMDGPSQLLARMLRSVEAAEASFHSGKIRLLLNLQQYSAKSEPWRRNLPHFVDVQTTASRLSLSKARNDLLAEASANGLLRPGDIIAFPDDDAWYPQGVLEKIIDLFSANPDLEFLFARYSAAPVDVATFSSVAPQTPHVTQVVREASSNTIFVRGRLIPLVGCFDEQLGVGSLNGSGEDVDYALKAYSHARATLFIDLPLIGHRNKNKALRAKYYQGSLVAIARNAGRAHMRREMLRKYVVGIYLVLRNELTLGEFVRAAKAALRTKSAIDTKLHN